MILHRTAEITILAAGLLLAVTPVCAGDYATDSGARFSRGLANTVTGWGEIPKNITNESRDKNVFAGITYGTARGTAHTAGRTVVGAFDLVTFIVPTHELYIRPMYGKDTGSEPSYGVQ